MNDIDRAFEILKADVLKRTKDGTSCEDVVQLMYENSDKIWWMSWDFINKTTKKGKFLSHRAPARASDLAIHNSQLVEDRDIGRFKAYRLRTENSNLIEKYLGIKNPHWKQPDVPQKSKIQIVMRDGKPVAIEL